MGSTAKVGCGVVGAGTVISVAIALADLLFGNNFIGRWAQIQAAQNAAAPSENQVAQAADVPLPHSTINRLDFEPPKKERAGLIETQLKQRRPVELIEVRTSCKGSPSDHTTFGLNLKNNSDHTVVVDGIKFNVGQFRVMAAPVNRPKNCMNEWTGQKNPIVDLDFGSIKVGDSVAVEVSLEIPPGETRSFGVSFQFKQVEAQDLPYVLLQGTLILPFGDGEIIQPLELCGQSDDGAIGQSRVMVYSGR